jgi:drug/metabolite transporter (DMT)-like permease
LHGLNADTLSVKNMDANLIGEAAALATSTLWTFNTLFFTTASKKIGPLSVNAYRVVLAVGFLVAAHTVLLGTVVPNAGNEHWFWLGLSGIIGLGIGDFGLFSAFVTLGPRRTVLVMALSPIFASFGAYVLSGETISPLAIAGMSVTLAGIIVVILEREQQSGEQAIPNGLKLRGIILALVGAVGQGVGLALSKKGINLDPNAAINPLSATLMRMTFGALFVWISLAAVGRLPELRRAVSDRSGMKHTVAGAFLGPFLGVTLSMVAVTFTQAGIAQTLMSLMPVMIIPVVWAVNKQKTSWRGIIGAMIAVVGVTIIFLT